MKKVIWGVAFLLVCVSISAEAGSIVAWGYDNHGQVSNVPQGDDFVAIGAGAYYGIALRSDGSLVCWGDDSTGIVRNTPSGNDFVGIVKNGASSQATAYAIKSDGSIVGWGYPPYVPSGTGFTKVDCMSTYGVALKSNGTVVTWKTNGSPQENAPSGNNFIDIAGDAYHALALRSDGTITAWGDNHFGQSNIPTGNDYIDIACAYGTTSLALRSNGEVVVWGWDIASYNGFGSGDFVKLFSGYQYNAFALRADGSLAGWGIDEGGMITNMPTGYFADIACGEYFGLALTPEPCTLLLLGVGGILVRKR